MSKAIIQLIHKARAEKVTRGMAITEIFIRLALSELTDDQKKQIASKLQSQLDEIYSYELEQKVIAARETA